MFVERFMAWTVSAGADQRAEAISNLVKTYFTEEITDQDKLATEQVFTLYLDDPSVKVRANLACALCEGDTAPRTLIWSLMQDIPEVSAEVYRGSKHIRNADLIHAISQNEPLIQIAIAMRLGIDGDIARALVAHACEVAVEHLLSNPSIVLGPGLKHDIALRLGHEPTIRAILLAEDDLRPATRQLLIERLSGALLGLSEEKGWACEKRMANAANDACNRAALDIMTAAGFEDIAGYVEHLRDSMQLTPALLVRAVCSGNAALFEHALALLSGASLKRVQSIVDEGRIPAFKSLYAKTGLPQSAYPVFTAAIRVWQSENGDIEALNEIIAQVENDQEVDGALLALLGRMMGELQRENAKTYERQLLLDAA